MKRTPPERTCKTCGKKERTNSRSEICAECYVAQKKLDKIEEEKKLEEDRKWMDLQLAKLKASGKWDEWYTKAREETPENQRQFEYLIITRIKQRIRMNITK